MNTPSRQFPDTKPGKAARQILKIYMDDMKGHGPGEVFMFGGMAIHFYVANRDTFDIDMIGSRGMNAHRHMIVNFHDERGFPVPVYFDQNHNEGFMILHPEAKANAVTHLENQDGLVLKIMQPDDLIAIASYRFDGRDRQDMLDLFAGGWATPESAIRRITEAAGESLGKYGKCHEAIAFLETLVP